MDQARRLFVDALVARGYTPEAAERTVQRFVAVSVREALEALRPRLLDGVGDVLNSAEEEVRNQERRSR